jgi:hypothetical protein
MSAETPEVIDLSPGEIEDSRTGVMLVRVGGRAYPARQVPQCRTCRSKYRTQIELGIINGMPYLKLVEELVDPFQDHSPLGPPTMKSIMNHVARKHMPVPYSTKRQIIEERAREIGRSVEEGEQLLVDNVAVHRTIVQRGFERLNAGEIEPTMGDLMKALQIQAAVEGPKDEGGLDEDAWREALMEYMTIVQRIVSLDQLGQIKHEMASSPVLQEIAARRRTVPGQLEN